MTLRADRLEQYKVFWQLAVRGRMAEAEAWRLANERTLSLWDDIAMPFPGFYRSKKDIPIAFWLEAPKDDAGELLGEPFLVMQNGRGRAKVEKDLRVHGHLEFWMTWERCRHDAVTEPAYRYAVANFDEVSGIYPWADRQAKTPIAPARADLRNSPSIF